MPAVAQNCEKSMDTRRTQQTMAYLRDGLSYEPRHLPSLGGATPFVSHILGYCKVTLHQVACHLIGLSVHYTSTTGNSNSEYIAC